MTDIDTMAIGQQCRECGGCIAAGEGYLLCEGDEPIAYVHTTCA